MSPIDFKDGVDERPECEDCGKPALRAVPVGGGKFLVFCEKCYQKRRLKPLKEQLKEEIMEELKNDYDFIPKVDK